MNGFRNFRLAIAALLIAHCSKDGGAQPLAINPSAAPSDINNPSSINPAARASDVWNPSAVNPAAAASQIPQPGGLPLGPGDRVPRVGQQRSAPLSSPTIERVPRSRITAREIEERRKREREPGWSARPGVETWQELRDHLATCPRRYRNQKLDTKYKVARYQILLALRLLRNANPLPQFNSHQIEKFCRVICEK